MDQLREAGLWILGSTVGLKLVEKFGIPLINGLLEWLNPNQRRQAEQQRRQQELEIDERAKTFWGATIDAQNREIAALREEIADHREQTRKEIAAMKASHSEELEAERAKRKAVEEKLGGEIEQLQTKVARLEEENRQLREQLERRQVDSGPPNEERRAD